MESKNIFASADSQLINDATDNNSTSGTQINNNNNTTNQNDNPSLNINTTNYSNSNVSNESIKRNSTTEHTFQKAKKVAKDPRLQKNNALPTSNQFDIFSNMDADVDSENTPSDTNKNTNKNEKPPPIYLKTQVNFNDLCAHLESVGGPDSFKCVATIRGITIRPATPAAYRLFVDSFRVRGAEFHTFQLPEDKAYRVVIRGLHSTIPTADITAALNEHGFKVRSVTNVLSQNKEMLPLFFVDLEPDRNNENIFDITTLLHSVIKVEEPRRKRHIVQCIRCQAFGHTKAYCNYAVRCVRCGGTHESSQCVKPKEQDPKCANCDGKHPANYRGCLVHKQLQQIRANKKNYSNQAVKNQKLPVEMSPIRTASNFPNLPLHNPSSQESSKSPKNLIQQTQKGPANTLSFSQVTKNSTHLNQSLSYVPSSNVPSYYPSSTHSHLNVSSSNEQTTQNITSLTSILSQLQSLIQPLVNLITQLTHATQALLIQHGH